MCSDCHFLGRIQVFQQIWLLGYEFLWIVFYVDLCYLRGAFVFHINLKNKIGYSWCFFSIFLCMLPLL